MLRYLTYLAGDLTSSPFCESRATRKSDSAHTSPTIPHLHTDGTAATTSRLPAQRTDAKHKEGLPPQEQHIGSTTPGNLTTLSVPAAEPCRHCYLPPTPPSTTCLLLHYYRLQYYLALLYNYNTTSARASFTSDFTTLPDLPYRPDLPYLGSRYLHSIVSPRPPDHHTLLSPTGSAVGTSPLCDIAGLATRAAASRGRDRP